ncbi:interferon-induced protein with tetratricopeptide repeats 5-like [Ptychodera flava]|uniref:interferon-induced protein with tetratricopeptide repeats 5-like n=1 Tax=Ptychodera flava TaxID=63121 RepID=UPI00396A8839
MASSTTTDSSAFEESLHEYQCHFTWNLEDKCDRDFKTIMEYIDHHIRYNPEQMPVPATALKAYLYVSTLKGNDNTRPIEALELLDRALEINGAESSRHKHDGAQGDRVVLLANKACVYLNLGKRDEAERLKDELEQMNANSEKACAYVDAHKAFACQWFSRSKFGEAIECYKKALAVFPFNVDWLFGYTRFLEKTDVRSQSSNDGVSPVTEIELNLRKILECNPGTVLPESFSLDDS